MQAMRFMSGLSSVVQAVSDPPKLKVLVETLGFGHLLLDVTTPLGMRSWICSPAGL